MLIYIISGLMLFVICATYILGEKLYKVPEDTNYFDNVTQFNTSNEKEIGADPMYVTLLSSFTGVLIGLYLAYMKANKLEGLLVTGMVIIIFLCYLVELTRKIKLGGRQLILSRLFYKTKVINVTEIRGMYIYSYNRRFLKKHAFTTKLIVVKNDGKKIKFTLSSIDNRAVLNMMKDDFGVVKNKMYIHVKPKMPEKV